MESTRLRLPHDLTEYLRDRLAGLPGGTRVVLVWDPRQVIGRGDTILDRGGQAWNVFEFAGEDAAFLRQWATRDRQRRAIVLLRLRQQPRRRLDLSYQDQLLREAEAFIDLRLAAVFTHFTHIAWNEEAVHAVEPWLIRNLHGALAALGGLVPVHPVGVHELRAVALASFLPQRRAAEFLDPASFDAAGAVVWYLRLLADLPDSAYKLAQQFAADRFRSLPAAQPWIAVDPAAALKVLYVAKLVQAYGLPVEPVRLRGYGVVEAGLVPPLALWPVLRQRLADSGDAAAIYRRGGELLGAAALDAVIADLGVPPAERIAEVFAALPRLAGDRVLERFVSSLAGAFDPLAEIARWAGPAEWAAWHSPAEPPAGPIAAAVTLLSTVVSRMGADLAETDDMEAMADAYVARDLATLEFDLAQALDYLRSSPNVEVRAAGVKLYQHIRPSVRAALDRADRALARAIGRDVDAFNQHERSVTRLIKQEVFDRGRRPPHVPHVWLVIFDGMRWDTWVRVIRPALAEAFEAVDGGREAPRFAVLPSFTGVSRTSLMAGAPPDGWYTLNGERTQDEGLLGARGFGLRSDERAEKWQLVKRAEDQIELWLAPGAARPYNTLVYNVSDDRIHNFGSDVAELNRQIRTMLRDRLVQDLLALVGEGDVLIVASDHGFIELEEADGVEVPISPPANVSYRYIAGQQLEDRPGVMFSQQGTYTLAVGREWFRRPGGHGTRYAHGGLSFAELLVPGAVFTRSQTERLDLSWERRSLSMGLTEGDEKRVPVVLANKGNRAVRYALEATPMVRVEEPAGELAPHEAREVTLVLSAPPGRHHTTASGRFGRGAAFDHEIAPLVIELTVAERTDRVEFSFDALDLLEEPEK